MVIVMAPLVLVYWFLWLMFQIVFWVLWVVFAFPIKGIIILWKGLAG